jgi:5'-3' exonuclease
MKFLLLDGLNLICKLYFTKKNVNLCSCWLFYLNGILHKFNLYKKNLILFGEGVSYYRKNIYPYYKKFRLKIRVNLITLIPFINKLSLYIKATFLKLSGFKFGAEADDLIYSFLKVPGLTANKKSVLVILSSDKDFIPCMNKNVFIYNNGLRSNLYYKNKFNLKCLGLFKFILEIAGDISDNIRGVSSIGKSNVLNLLCSFKVNLLSADDFFLNMSYKKKYFFKKFFFNLRLNKKLILLKNYLNFL